MESVAIPATESEAAALARRAQDDPQGCAAPLRAQTAQLVERLAGGVRRGETGPQDAAIAAIEALSEVERRLRTLRIAEWDALVDLGKARLLVGVLGWSAPGIHPFLEASLGWAKDALATAPFGTEADCASAEALVQLAMLIFDVAHVHIEPVPRWKDQAILHKEFHAILGRRFPDAALQDAVHARIRGG